MYQVMQGIRVIEAAAFLQVPTAGAVLADWGAEVIKIEHPVTGDPFRALLNDAIEPGLPNPMLELPNRGKRSVGLDFTKDDGREILCDLVRDSDVFLTSFRAPVLERFGLDYESLRRLNPRLVYARSTGFGPRGPEADSPGYDLAATWGRAGLLHQMTDEDSDTAALQPGSLGDLTGGLSLAAGVAAALFHRERTGEGTQIDVSLLHVGMWFMSQTIGAAALGIERAPFRSTKTPPRNPLIFPYRTSDHRWLMLCMTQPDRYWRDLCAHVGRAELADDPRFSDHVVRAENASACVHELAAIFAEHDFATWRQRLATMEGPWAPCLNPREIVVDPQVVANGYIAEVQRPDGETFGSVSSPIQFGGLPLGIVAAMPEHAQHTEEVLLEHGLTWDDLIRLKESGAIT